MGETKKIVVVGFPVEKLPEELRVRFDPNAPVKITVEQGSDFEAPASRTMRSFFGSGPGLYESPEEVVAFIRKLRDESDR